MRKLQILELLIQQDQYTTSQELSKIFGVSTRTIYNDIKTLSSDGEKNGFELILKRNLGYYIQVTNQAKLQEYINSMTVYKEYSIKDRYVYILSRLLLSNHFMTQETLANELQVSQSLIKIDLKKIESYFQNTNIKLLKKPYYGILLKVTNENRIKLIFHLYDFKNSLICQTIDSFYKKEFCNIQTILITLLNENNLYCNDNEFHKMDKMLKIIIYLSIHSVLENEKNTCKVDINYYKIAKAYSKKINKIYGICLLENVIWLIAKIIRDNTRQVQSSILYKEELQREINEFFMVVDKEYQTKFLEDKQFIDLLYSHISLLLERLNNSITLRNPLIVEISAKYPFIFNLAIQLAFRLSDKFGVTISHDEIGFIATHFAAHMEKENNLYLENIHRIAVICCSGGGASYLIKLKLETLFHSSDIRIFSIVDLDKVKQFLPNIVFTIAKVDLDIAAPIIQINELLDDNDMIKIKNRFSLNTDDDIENLSNQIFKKELFKCIDKDVNYIDLLENMGKAIEMQGYAPKGYLDKVFQREEVLSTIYQNGVAIPHPIDMCGVENVVNVAILNKPITYENKEVRIVFMISLAKGSSQIHQHITKVLLDIISNPLKLDQLIKSKTFDEFMIQIKHNDW